MTVVPAEVKEAQPIEIIEQDMLAGFQEEQPPAVGVKPSEVKDDEIEIIIAESKTPAPEPVDPKRKDYSDVEKTVEDPKVKKRFAQLTWERENAKREAAQLKAERDEAIRVAQLLANRATAQATENHTVANYAVNIGREKVKGDLSSARQELMEAQSNGDAKRIADATEKMARAQAEALRVEDVTLPEAPVQPQEVLAYQQLQQRFQQQQELQARQAAHPQPDPEIVDNFRSWASQNPWYQPAQVDPTSGALLPRNKESLYAEQLSSILELEGKAFGTAEHFAELERRLPWKSQGVPQSTNQQPSVPQTLPRQSSSPAVAPVGVSRSSAGRKTYTLSPEQAHIAKEFGMTPQEYAKEFFNV